ncbi:ABC transporter ATP-binding protein [bacterium]|nr:ABC transporter ATP-binding protein [bacterium]
MSTTRRLLTYLKPYWRRCILALGAIFLFAALNGISLTLIVPFLDNLFKNEPTGPAQIEMSAPETGEPNFLDRAEGWKDRSLSRARGWLDRGEARERLMRGLMAILLAYFLKNLFDYIQAYLVHYLEQRSLYDIRRDLYSHLQRLPLGFFHGQQTGVLISRVVNDVNTLKGAIVGATASLFRNGLMVIVGLIIIFAISWKLSLLTFLIVPINALLMRTLGKLLRRDSTRIQVRMGEMAGAIGETVTGARVVKAFGREADEVKRFGYFNLDYFKSSVRLRALGALNAPLSEMLGSLSVVFIVGYGGVQVLQGNMEASHLVLFVVAVLSIVGPLRRISELNQIVQEGVAAGERIFQILDEESERSCLEHGEVPGPLSEAIRFENVEFGYREGLPVIHDLNLEISKGQIVALVGPSGGGKSTLADLLARFYEPDAGRLSVDGRDLREFKLSSWRDKFGIVTQDVLLFNDSILNNIAYGRPSATREMVEEAARAARAHDFILDAPEGYDTIIGERGLQLSGGQRQRLAIARALLKDPEILIFDEATSALDTESEMLVQEAIDRLMSGRTALVIAHRLSTIHGADRIAVIDNGQLVQEGRHDELMAAGGLYRQLYEMQFAQQEKVDLP